MAIVTVTESGRQYRGDSEVAAYLGEHGIWYRRFEGLERLPESANEAEILEAYAAAIEEQKLAGGYLTADVIDIQPDTPGLQAMLEKFSKEHWHDEDEVRFIVEGRGIFHVNPDAGPVFRIEVSAGDMINVPSGTRHWFDLCEESRIRAIRLFIDRAGWIPRYSESGIDAGYEPLCFGPGFIPPPGSD